MPRSSDDRTGSSGSSDVPTHPDARQVSGDEGMVAAAPSDGRDNATRNVPNFVAILSRDGGRSIGPGTEAGAPVGGGEADISSSAADLVRAQDRGRMSLEARADANGRGNASGRVPNFVGNLSRVAGRSIGSGADVGAPVGERDADPAACNAGLGEDVMPAVVNDDQDPECMVDYDDSSADEGDPDHALPPRTVRFDDSRHPGSPVQDNSPRYLPYKIPPSNGDDSEAERIQENRPDVEDIQEKYSAAAESPDDVVSQEEKRPDDYMAEEKYTATAEAFEDVVNKEENRPDDDDADDAASVDSFEELLLRKSQENRVDVDDAEEKASADSLEDLFGPPDAQIAEAGAMPPSDPKAMERDVGNKDDETTSVDFGAMEVGDAAATDDSAAKTSVTGRDSRNEDDKQKCEEAVASEDDEEAVERRRAYAAEKVRDWKETRQWVEDTIGSLSESELANVDIQMLDQAMNCKPEDAVSPSGVKLQQFTCFRRKEWLDDSAVFYTLRCLQERATRSFTVLDPILLSLSSIQQADSLKNIFELGRKSGIVISPQNYNTHHWIVLVIDLQKKKVVLFDPLDIRACYAHMLRTVNDTFKPWIRDLFPLVEEKYRDFQQPDGYNCGLYVIEFVRHYVNGTLKEFKNNKDPTVDASKAQLRRLEYFCMLVKYSEPTAVQPRKRRRRGYRAKKGDEPEQASAPDTESDPETRPRIPKRRNVLPDSPTSPCDQESPQPSPINLLTMGSLPLVNGKKIDWAGLRRELVAFVHRYRHQGVTLGIVCKWFENHIDASNRLAFSMMFADITAEKGSTFRLDGSPGDSSNRILVEDFFKYHVGSDKLAGAKEMRDAAQKFLGQKINRALYSKVWKTMMKDAGKAVPDDAKSESDSTDESPKAKSPVANDSESTKKTPKANSSPKTQPSQSTEVPKQPPQSTEAPPASTDATPTAKRRPKKQTSQSVEPKVKSRAKKQLSESPKVISQSDNTTGPDARSGPNVDPEATEDELPDKRILLPSRKRLRQPSVEELEAKQIPKGQAVVENVVSVRKGKNGQWEYEVRWEKTGGKKRQGTEWKTRKDLNDFKGFELAFKDQIEMLKKMNELGMTKREFFKKFPEARAFNDLRKHIAADGDGWCSFRAVGYALYMLTGRDFVTTPMIEEFQARGLERNPHRTDTKCGAKWPEILAFTRRICSKKVGHGVELDFEEYCRNRHRMTGAGLKAIGDCKLEPGIFLLSGFDFARTYGHCVVLEVFDDKITVHDDDAEGGVEILDWLHEVSFIRRLKLKSGNKQSDIFGRTKL
jgi:hypothetical protein